MKTFKKIAFFMFLILLGTGMTSCVVRLKENHRNNAQHRDNGKHRGWYKNKNHHDNKIYIIDNNENKKHSKASRSNKVKNQKKNRWDARK